VTKLLRTVTKLLRTVTTKSDNLLQFNNTAVLKKLLKKRERKDLKKHSFLSLFFKSKPENLKNLKSKAWLSETKSKRKSRLCKEVRGV